MEPVVKVIDGKEIWEDQFTPAECRRGELEVDALLAKLALDPILAPLLARCPHKPFCGLYKFWEKDKGELRFFSLLVPCPDRATADFLNNQDWGEYYIPFQGQCWCLAFPYPGGAVSHIPKDPRANALEAAVRALLPAYVRSDVEKVEYEFTGWSESYSDFPVVFLGCSTLVTFNQYFRYREAIQSLVRTLIPEAKRLSFHLAGYEGITAVDGLMASWRWEDGQWQGHPVEEREITQYAYALLAESGLELPHQWRPCRFVGLDARIGDRVLYLSGERDAVQAALAILEPMRVLQNRLRYLSPLAALERVEFDLGGKPVAFPFEGQKAALKPIELRP